MLRSCETPRTDRAFHAGAPPIGSFDVTTSFSPTPAQNETAGQETSKTPPGTSTLVACHDPPAGSVEVRICRPPPTATHMEVEAHETFARLSWVTRGLGAHAESPPVGSVDVMTWPWSPTATQSDAEGHETSLRRR
jgi:hypothetical protein